ncbi:MAG: glycosyltransferase [Bacteroidales bacterium]|jgi:glycosyltransferase involved in cell wall biosynthesis|nr:glycosyltransferase [Bacteroidales bacterium]
MEKPLVSIICITYNHEPFIRETLEGFIKQKVNFPIEVLINEDLSTDNTASIVKEFEEKYPNIIKPIYQKENQYSKGINPWFDILFPLAQGKYIAICEGDDYWVDENKLQKQVDFLENNKEYGLVFTELNFKYEDEGRVIENIFKNNLYPLSLTFEEHLQKAGYLAPCTWVFKTELIRDLPKEKQATDTSFVLMLEIMLRTKIYFLSDNTTVYRFRSGSASRPEEKKRTYLYRKGIFEVQLNYSNKYLQNNKPLQRKIKQRGYINLMFLAISCKDKQFIKDMLLCFLSIKENVYYGKKNNVLLFFDSIFSFIRMLLFILITSLKTITKRIFAILKIRVNVVKTFDKILDKLI